MDKSGERMSVEGKSGRGKKKRRMGEDYGNEKRRAMRKQESGKGQDALPVGNQ